MTSQTTHYAPTTIEKKNQETEQLAKALRENLLRRKQSSKKTASDAS